MGRHFKMTAEMRAMHAPKKRGDEQRSGTPPASIILLRATLFPIGGHGGGGATSLTRKYSALCAARFGGFPFEFPQPPTELGSGIHKIAHLHLYWRGRVHKRTLRVTAGARAITCILSQREGESSSPLNVEHRFCIVKGLFQNGPLQSNDSRIPPRLRVAYRITDAF